MKSINLACTPAEGKAIVEWANHGCLRDGTVTTPAEANALRKAIKQISPTYLRISGDKGTIKKILTRIN